MSPDRGWHLETLHSAFLHFPPFSPRATCFTGLDPLEAPPLQNKAGHCLLPFNRGGSTMHSARRNWGESQSSPRIHHTRRGGGWAWLQYVRLRLHLSCLLHALCNPCYFSAEEPPCTSKNQSLVTGGVTPEHLRHLRRMHIYKWYI